MCYQPMDTHTKKSKYKSRYYDQKNGWMRIANGVQVIPKSKGDRDDNTIDSSSHFNLFFVVILNAGNANLRTNLHQEL